MMNPFFSASPAAAQVQLWLRVIARQNGEAPLPAVDGVYSENTADAVRRFQSAHNLPANGIVDFATWNAIRAAYLPAAAAESLPVPLEVLPPSRGQISEGQAGGNIYILQAILNALAPHYANIQPLPYSGEFDAATRDSIREIQRAAGLPINGAVDRFTWNAIANLYNAHQLLVPIDWELAEQDRQ